jgi:hypothetical protein
LAVCSGGASPEACFERAFWVNRCLDEGETQCPLETAAEPEAVDHESHDRLLGCSRAVEKRLATHRYAAILAIEVGPVGTEAFFAAR